MEGGKAEGGEEEEEADGIHGGDRRSGEFAGDEDSGEKISSCFKKSSVRRLVEKGSGFCG